MKFIMKTTYSAHKTLVLRSLKDHIQEIYKIPCWNCEKSYFCCSDRNICQHVQEHTTSTDNNNSLLTHIIETGHSFDSEKLKIITKMYNKTVSELQEGIAIMINSNTNNRN